MVYTFSFDALLAGRPWGKKTRGSRQKLPPPCKKRAKGVRLPAKIEAHLLRERPLFLH